MTNLNDMFPPIKLRRGFSDSKDLKKGLCLMQMVDWFSGHNKCLTDKPSCASPVLTTLAIYLNDRAIEQEKRDSLWPFVWKLIGSKDDEVEDLRKRYLEQKIQLVSWFPFDGSAAWYTLYYVLDEALKFGKHGEIDPTYAPRHIKLVELLEKA